MFLLSTERRQYGELILSLKNDYAKHQRKYLWTLPDMYGIMGVFEPTRVTAVAGGRNEGLNFGNVVVASEVTGDGDHNSVGVIGRKLD